MDKNKRILLVDDDIKVLQPVSEELSDEGYTVVTAAHAGLGALRSQYVDLVILDLQLSPEKSMEGGSILAHIWEDAWCDIPVIVFSGLVGFQEADETLKQIEYLCGKGRNIFRCIPKSGGIEPLVNAVNECFMQQAA